jgi:hypothetical protein
MNKIAFKIIFLFLLAANLYPLYAELQTRVEIRAAGFIPSNERFRDIYHNIGASYQIEASASLFNCMDVWVNADWFSKHGNPCGCDGSTRVSIVNSSFGIRLPFKACGPLTPYLGIGPSFGNIRLRNKTRCCRESVSKFAVGVVVKSGIYYCICGCAYIDLFVDYLYQPVNFTDRVDIGGVKAGLGIGFKF